MPYVKVKIELTYYISSLEDVETTVEQGIEDLHNECVDWSNGTKVPEIDFEVVEEAEYLGEMLLNYTKWEA